jgi:hypothetical protein
MEVVSLKIEDPLLDRIESKAEDEYDGNRSRAIRGLIEDGFDVPELEAEIERLDRRLDQEAALRKEYQERDEMSELATVGRDLREILYTREKLRVERETAGLSTRLRWFLFGRDMSAVGVDSEDDTSDSNK